MLRTFQTKINILDSHINPLMKFLIQGLRKVLNKSKEKFQILHISHTYLINLTFQNLQNFGMLQTTTLKAISSSRFEKASKKRFGIRDLPKISFLIVILFPHISEEFFGLHTCSSITLKEYHIWFIVKINYHMWLGEVSMLWCINISLILSLTSSWGFT